MKPSGSRSRAVRSLILAAVLAAILGICAAEPDPLLTSVEAQYGPAARLRVERWQTLIADATVLSELEKLARVNDFFNRVRFVHDIDHWGDKDYWATPLEFLGTNAGDCEDFSIAKYATLARMGVPQERLRLTYVKSLTLNQAHMVLTYYSQPGADPLVLDNLEPRIRRASQRADLYPVYSFNGNGLWVDKTGGKSRRVGDANRLSRWKKLQRRFAMTENK